LGWAICKVDDCVTAKRCFHCSRYNHTYKECKGEETCPLCTGNHELKECTSTKSDYKCTNCLIYNKHHPTTQTDTAHFSRQEMPQSVICARKIQAKHRLLRILPGKPNSKMATRHSVQIKCNQINLQHSRATIDNLMQVIATENTDSMLIQEPYLYQNSLKGITRGYRTYTCGGGKSRAAIVIPNNTIDALLLTQFSDMTRYS
jgi:hypothetical protein